MNLSRRMRLFVMSAAAVGVGGWTSCAGAAVVYDAGGDFSASANENGPWAYGYSQSITGPLVLYDRLDTGLGVDRWTSSNYGADPNVSHNPTGSDLEVIGITFPATGLQFHPGPLGEFSHVVWTAPAAGAYEVEADFSGLNPRPTTTDVHVLVGGVEVYSLDVSGYGPAGSYADRVALSAGEKVDFAVGRGGDGDYLFDSTGLDVRISAAPEPGGAGTLAGLVLWGLTRRRIRHGRA